MTVWEAIYMHCCATKRLPYLSDQEVFGYLRNTFQYILIAFWVPIYRAVHFYFSHR